jgi:hypothetical protein
VTTGGVSGAAADPVRVCNTLFGISVRTCSVSRTSVVSIRSHILEFNLPPLLVFLLLLFF